MSGRIAGVPGRLEDYARRTTASLVDLEGEVADYRAQLRRLLDAPSDVPIAVEDRSGEIAEIGAQLTAIDQLPAGIAFALRELDDTHVDLERALGEIATAVDDDEFDQYVTARLAAPFASNQEVRGQFEQGGACPPMPENPEELTPWYFAGGGMTLTFSAGALSRTERELTAAASRGGQAGQTQTWARAARLAGRAFTAGGVALQGVEQYTTVRDDPNLTPGQKTADIAAHVAFDGLFGAVGGGAGTVAGGVGGGAVGGPPGSVAGGGAGAVAGAKIGTLVGGALRRFTPIQWLIDGYARGIDGFWGTGHPDDFDHTIHGH